MSAKSGCFVAHRCVDKEQLALIWRRHRLLNKLTPDPSIIPVLSRRWCFAPRAALITAGERWANMIREEKKREDGGKKGGGWMDLKKEAAMWEGVDLGDGGRVSECWWCWVMKYSVRVCLWLLPSLFFPPSDIAG